MLSKRFLFRFCLPVRRIPVFADKHGVIPSLNTDYTLIPLGELETPSGGGIGGGEVSSGGVNSGMNSGKIGSGGVTVRSRPRWDFRLAWHEKGLIFAATLEGKKRPPIVMPNAPEDSDGITICLDTRDVRNVHRGSRFCHRLVFLPTGGGADQKQPMAFWLPVHRAKSPPNPVDVQQIRMRCECSNTGYGLTATIPGNILTGYAPLEYTRIGLHYSVTDREFGQFGLFADPPFPHDSDPSLWCTLDLLP